MSKFVRWMALPVVAVLAACGGQSDSERLDEALTRDLALAASMQYPQQQFMSPMEMGYAQAPYGQYPQPQHAVRPVRPPRLHAAAGGAAGDLSCAGAGSDDDDACVDGHR